MYIYISYIDMKGEGMDGRELLLMWSVSYLIMKGLGRL